MIRSAGMINSVTCPDGYYLGDRADVEPGEIAELRVRGQWRPSSLEHWRRVLEADALAIVTIRDEKDNGLVSFGDVYKDKFQPSNPREIYGSLGFQMVHPDHRRRGLGRLTLYERVRLADEAGITHLYAVLLDENTMPHVYAELGFTATPSRFYKELLRQRI